MSLVRATHLVEIITIYTQGIKQQVSTSPLSIPENKEDRVALTKIMFQIADTILRYYKKQSLYD